jgi:hypothetical protein
MPIIKIVSGGQTGADRGGLDAAIHCKIPHGGWCPRGRLAEDGVIPPQYQLRETSAGEYIRRTEANVVDSNATIIFTLGELSGGSLSTMEFARQYHKPVLHIDLRKHSGPEAVKLISGWLKGDGSRPAPPANCVLNVAGAKESNAPGLREKVTAIMTDLLAKNKV